MGISNQEYKRRHTLIRERMKQEGLDCLLVYGLGDDFNRGNIRYVTGSGRGGCCVFPLEGAPVFLMGPGQSRSPKLPRTLEAHELLDLRETADNIGQVGQEISRFQRGNRTGIIGAGCTPGPLYVAVKEKLGAQLTDSTAIFAGLRAVKSAEEIEKMRRSAAIADEVYAVLKKVIRPGLSDYEIYAQVKKTAIEAGCEYSFDLIDASGSRMNMTFFPTGERLEKDNTLFMEITPAYEGYYCQLPVTLPVERFPPVIRKMAAAWEKANAAALPLLRPGTVVSDIYHALVDTVRENGFISPLRPGHSIGLDALDFWSITAENNIVLKAGMTLAVHPSIMTEIGGDACGMGYTYLIKETGAERFSRVDLTENWR